MEQFPLNKITAHHISVSEVPLVYVSILTFNHVEFIEECIESILHQKTTFSVKIVIFDDCSTDGTTEILKLYKVKYPHLFILFLQKHNTFGKPDRKNVMFPFYEYRGKAQYTALCEGDDYWADDTKLQQQILFLENNRDFVIAYHDSKIIDSSGELVATSKLREKGRDLTSEDIIRGVLIPTNTVVFRNVFQSPPIHFFNVLNGDTFYFALLGQFGKAKFLPAIASSIYRLHNNGIWGLKPSNWKLRQALNTYKNLEQCIEAKHLPIVRNKVFALIMTLACREIKIKEKFLLIGRAYLYLSFQTSFKTVLATHLRLFRSFFISKN